jgi:hypothetical protein
MALFDAISEFIKPISDVLGDVGGAVKEVVDSPYGRVGKAAIQGIGSVDKRAKARAEQARTLQRDYSVGIGTNVAAGEAQWGLNKYSVDPTALENYWQNVLTQFITPSATKGPK